MADNKQPTGPQGGDYYPPPPPGPPPGHNGLQMHPNETPIQDAPSDIYSSSPPTASGAQQTAHQPPPADTDDAPKKTNWTQRLSVFGSKAAAPFNMLANKLGSEAFLPSTMDKECEKAARILRNFCKDGIYTDTQAPETVEAPTVDADGKPTTAAAKPRKNRTLLTIPSSVINKAVGLAIFTTARAGFHVSGATGSGVIIARLPDGSWSPPSGIQVHSVGAGFMIGIDIYDCVVVINTREALQAFTKTRMSLGSDLAVVAGPWGAGGSVDFAAPTKQAKEKGAAATVETEGAKTTKETTATDDYVHDVKETTAPPVVEQEPPRRLGEYTSWGSKKPSTTTSNSARPANQERKPSGIKQSLKQPTYSYVKSRGFYAGVQVDGTIFTERKDANAAFYGETVAVQQILAGEVPLVPGKAQWAELVRPLLDTIKGAAGWHGAQAGGGAWANQMGPSDPNSTYGAAHDPVFENAPPKPPRPTADGGGGVTQGVADMSLHSNHNKGGAFRAAAGGGGGEPSSSDGGAAAAATETPGARAKAAEAAAESEMNREREERERREAAGVADPRASTGAPPPGYTEMEGAGDSAVGAPPAYVDDGVPKAGTGDGKGSAGRS